MPATPSLPRSGTESADPVPSSAVGSPTSDDTGRRAVRTAVTRQDDAADQARGLPLGTILLGLFGVALIALGGTGAGGTLIHDPLLADTALSWIRYGHGKDLATAVLYGGLGLLVWAWIRLGRGVRAELVGRKAMLLTIGVWMLPLLVAPPLFSRDVYSYLAQGQLALEGFDPYQAGPSVLPGPLTENVSWVWQNTPAPYGPLFMLVAKGVVAVTGTSLIGGVVLIRLMMGLGVVLLCWSLPGLARHLGGRPAVALWLGVANPLMLVHLVGGAHNDMLMVGLLATGVLLVLERRHVSGVAVVTLATAVKATAVVALPFLVWVWAARLVGSRRSRFVRAAGWGVAIFVTVFTLCTLVAEVSLGWIPALRTSSTIVNWLSLPTALGQFVHLVVNWVVHVDEGIFLGITRGLGMLLLAWLAIKQWWAARDGGPEAVRRAAVTLLAVGLLSPATLPWYFSWPLVVGAGLAWGSTGLVLVALGSVWMLLVTFPSGDTALYSWGYLFLTLLAALLAAVSLVRPDPLRLSSRPVEDFLLPRMTR
ncbi:polyprenol phosphomannose-dependent alpha 1,6 mannosyltransferase MptB [Goodfellowiella coeruleoviolacea]|uniref:polyprenol phosphomannose-dependent alpha 1,6 mannosyltransferase MptB n=1 Tax=Goodfellowiella coeruleoviolacea TaxID=334858 RepID=UPI0020A5DF23|nr:polyprenol phosphomannose-dependent alpha 1,6 mannosyltransferase MptB [Goodfellowiella coeruleoviolacea]